jgi:hypothetical protein
MEVDQIFNLFEGILWISISAIMVVQSRRLPTHRTLLLVSGVAFFFFGLSDFIEIFTRAWFRPPVLLILKAVCVITLTSCFIVFRRGAKTK